MSLSPWALVNLSCASWRALAAEEVSDSFARPCSASKLDVAQYREGIAALVDEFYQSAVQLLEGEWLKLDGLDATIDAAGVFAGPYTCPVVVPQGASLCCKICGRVC